MAVTEPRPSRSASNGAIPAGPFAGLKPLDWLPAARPQMSEAAARANLTYLDIMDSWLAASRQMLDLWRTSFREQQDAMLASWRRQIANALANDLMEDTQTPRTRRRPGARRKAEAPTTRH